MIYVEVDFTEATKEEQEAIASVLDRLRDEGVLVSIRGLQEAVEALAEKLKDIFARQGMAAGDVLNDVKIYRLINLGGLNPAERQIVGEAFDLLQTEGIILQEEKNYRLTAHGQTVIYRD